MQILNLEGGYVSIMKEEVGMPFRFYHDTFFKEGFLMFIEDFIEDVINLNLLSQNIRVMSVIQRESTRPESGSADLCFEVIISTFGNNREYCTQFFLIVEHKSFYEKLAIFSQVKYHNGLYQEQISLGKKLLPVISLFCCHGKDSIKTPKGIQEILLKKGFSKSRFSKSRFSKSRFSKSRFSKSRFSQSSFELFKPFILSLKWLLLDFSDEKVLSLFKNKEFYYIVYILHQGSDFKLTEESLLEVIRLVSRIKDPYKKSKSMESVLAYLGSLSPDRMTDTLLQSVDFRAKKENLLKKGESIVKYSSMRELIRAEAREEGIEKGIVKGIEKGIVKGIEKGIVKGIEKGIVKGIEKGIVKGIEKGRVKGIEQGREEVALRMLRQDMKLQLIAQFTGLSIQQLQKLKK